MSVSKQIITEDDQLKLHFQQISKMQAEEPLRLKTQNARMDFIRYCIKRGDKLSDNAPGELEQFIFYENTPETQPSSYHSIAQEDPNKKKLSLLFAHLAAFNYEMGDLTIEAIAPAILIKKLNKINEMKPRSAQRYLDRLIGEKIPGYKNMSTDEFLKEIATLYKNEGLTFHCYLRENFFRSLIAKSIKSAEPLLNYFMPKVFSQQHINTCVIATQLTLTKKITASFNQLKHVFLSKEKELPEEVKKAESIILSLQNEFSDYLSRSSSKNPQEIKKIINEYQKQISIIQKELEVQILERYDPDFQPDAKKYDNFILSVLHHLISKITIPSSLEPSFNAIDKFASKQFNKFQKLFIKRLFNPSIDISTFCISVYGQQKEPLQQKIYEEQIKTMFLNGNACSHTKRLNLGHQLVMNIDEEGQVKIIEHKNAKPEDTILSTNILSTIGIPTQHREPAEKVIENIDETLKRLFMERENIVKIKKGTIENSAVQKELSKLLLEKDDEIRNLAALKQNIQQEHKVISTKEKFTDTKRSLQTIKENSTHQPSSPSPLSLK